MQDLRPVEADGFQIVAGIARQTAAVGEEIAQGNLRSRVGVMQLDGWQ